MKVKRVSSTEDETSILPPGLARVFARNMPRPRLAGLTAPRLYIEQAVAGGAANIPDGASESSHSSDLGTVLRRDCG